MDLSSLFKQKEKPDFSSSPQQLVQGPVVTRIAPSPTGPLHIGTARSALFNYLFAHHHKGQFIIRIEDTDQERGKEEFETDILEGLEWLGIKHDALYRQSERTQIYQSYIKQLLENSSAYLSKEKSKKVRGEEVEVVRLRNPNKKVSFQDMLRGTIEFDTTELGDFIIARNTNEPLYHLAVVIDDHEMKITHVIRGEDHISNTPRQILIQEALNLPRPHYVHIPLILTKDRSKMSKREGGSSIQKYREKGYFPEAVVNYLALLGWNPGTEKELFTLDELIASFDIAKIQRGGAVFDEEKLNWFNRQYIKTGISERGLQKAIRARLPRRITEMKGYNEKVLERLIPVLQEKIKVLAEIDEFAESGDLDYYFTKPKYDIHKLLWRDETNLTVTKSHIQEVGNLIQQIPASNFSVQSIKKAVWGYADEKGRGAVLWPMRYALSGKEKSPDPFTLAYVLGKRETLERLAETIEKTSDTIQKS